MSQQYYGESQWPGAGPAQSNWEHQTPPPPPARSGMCNSSAMYVRGVEIALANPQFLGASSTVPREVESIAFAYQFEGMYNLKMKSGGTYLAVSHGRRDLYRIDDISLSVERILRLILPVT